MYAFSMGIYREIFLRLPAESLIRFRTVCKQWRAAIDDPCFAKAHVDNQLSSNTIIIRNPNGPPFYPFYYFNLQDLHFTDAPQPIPVTPLIPSRSALSRLQYLPLPACNGLMLFGPGNSRVNDDPIESWEIWNPLTSEGLKLPDPNISVKVVGMGFGYGCVADDYRVVLIDYDGDSTRQTHVYSLKSDSWRKIMDCPFCFRSEDTQHGVFLNGSLHWVSCDDEVIVSFDLATENYQQLALPGLNVKKSMNLEALSGYLFLSYIGEEYGPFKYESDRIRSRHFDVWVMNDYGAEDSWVKLVSLNNNYNRFNGYNLRALAYMKSENRVLIKHENFFIWVDADSNSIKSVDIHGFCVYSEFSAQICARSLLRLHDTCGRVAASKIRTTKRGATQKADTKLTFCVRDYEKSKASLSSHANCYNIDLNWYTYSCQGDEVYTASSDPDTESSIPLDICREIFLHLPAKSLIRLRAVCKAYRAIIDEPCFVKAHTNNQLSSNTILFQNKSGPPFFPCYSFDLDDLYFTDGLKPILATPLGFKHDGLSRLSTSVCNGLILVAGETLEMWNPLTNECLQLPNGEFNLLEIITTGLGYDYATDDYKVVVIDRYPIIESDDDYLSRTHVYSLRSDSWRMIGNFPVGDDRCPKIWPGVFLCGALHWTSWVMHNKIIKLDLGTETYSEMQCPVVRRRHSLVSDQRSIEVLGGCLVWTDYSIAYDDLEDDMNVWLMKDYGDESSWINLYCIDSDIASWTPEGRFRPVAVMKNKTQILLQDQWGLFLCDVESYSLKKVNVHGLTKSSYAHDFSGSIFRLHDNCGGGSLTTQRRRIRKRQMDMEISDTELYFCVRDDWPGDSHDDLDLIWYYSSSSEDEGMYELQCEED